MQFFRPKREWKRSKAVSVLRATSIFRTRVVPLSFGGGYNRPYLFVRVTIICPRRRSCFPPYCPLGKLPEEPMGQQSNLDPQRERQRDHDHRGVVDVEPFLLLWLGRRGCPHAEVQLLHSHELFSLGLIRASNPRQA